MITAARLKEGEDLKQAICGLVKKHQLMNASVLAAVGSLSTARIRMAGARPGFEDIQIYEEIREIVSLTGTVDHEGKAHLHISVSDKNGQIVGGHLKDGCTVHTTVEVTLVSSPNLVFKRQHDEATGFDELYIEEIK